MTTKVKLKLRTDFYSTGQRRSPLARPHRIFRSRRRTTVPGLAWVSLLVVAISAIAARANGETEPSAHDAELERWVLSGGIEVGMFGNSASGEFSGSPLVGPRATNISTSDDVSTVVRSVRGDNDLLSGLIGPSFEVMTPSFLDVPSHPRFFLDLSLLGILTSEPSMAKFGSPGKYGLPDQVSFSAPFIGELFVTGTGTQITSQHHGFLPQVGLGPAFTFDFGEERIRIKPSIVYSRLETKVSAITRRAVRIVEQDPLTSSGRVRSLDSYRFISLQDDQTEVYHGLGPALEIEYLTRRRIGPFATSLFLKGVATHLFGDLKTEFSASNPEYPQETVRWKYQNDSWSYQASVGIRLSLVPQTMR